MIRDEMPKSPTIGIDFGTTYCSVGVWEHGDVRIIAEDFLPYVAFTDDSLLFGLDAKNQVAVNPTKTIFDVKRLVGRRFSEHSVQIDMKQWPFKVVAGADDWPMIVVEYNGKEKQFLAEEILSMLFRKMKVIAEANLNTTINNAVVAVPAHFNNSQRQATKDAGAIAGLNVLRLINEPSAAALAYGFKSSEGKGKSSAWKNVLVFDLGGGTFDAALLTAGSGLFEVKATAGDTHLGGEDFDNRMVNFFVEEFKKIYNKDVSGDRWALRRLRAECEQAKRHLSFHEIAPIVLSSFYEEIDYYSAISRDEFEELNMDLFAKCMEMVKTCLRDAEMDEGCVHQVLLVGGSTRIPRLQRLLADLFQGKPICETICPEEAVAYGAAIQAANLDRRGTKHLKGLAVLETTSLSIGVDSPGGLMEVWIPRNSFYPTEREVVATTAFDLQSALSILVYEGQMAACRDNHLVGQFDVLGISSAPRGVRDITLCFSIDADGILDVSAEEDDSIGQKKKQKKKNRVVFQTRGELRRDEIEQIVYKFNAEIYTSSRRASAPSPATVGFQKVSRWLQNSPLPPPQRQNGFNYGLGSGSGSGSGSGPGPGMKIHEEF